jgi:AraC-like DNA-binding protein
VPRRATAEVEISDRFRVPAPTLVSSIGRSPPMTFSRLRCDREGHGKTKAVPSEDAYALHVAMRPILNMQLWIAGQDIALPPVPRGGVLLVHNQSSPVAAFHSPFDLVRIYVSQATLDELADASGAPRPSGLRQPRIGAADPILYHLAASLTPFFETDAPGSYPLLDHVALAVHARLAAYAGKPALARSRAGGLAPWQERRTKQFIQENLHRDITLVEIAEQCGLSVSHFARAFRCTTGHAPHRWVLDRRVETAKQHLERGELSLAQITVACGFSDPSHLSRAFAKKTGETPGAWRRRRRLPV